jgi:hypothetical protein
MIRAKHGWVLINERPNPSRSSLRFAAQPKIYFEDGSARTLHEHSGETRQEAEQKAQAELDAYIGQHS